MEAVRKWLDKRFPKPCVDQEWLDGCSQWVEQEQGVSPITSFPKFMDIVESQLLESDLVDSMVVGSGFNPNIKAFTGILSGLPVLVQITAITEIGSSAFQLEQVRAAREERLLAGVGNEEGEGDGDLEVEGEGPLPKFPRATLRFQLSDGATTIEAMEYGPILGIALGVTPLGCKLQLKGTRFVNGMAMLEPNTIGLLGGSQADLDAKQMDDFKRGLRTRLGLPVEGAQVPGAHLPVVNNIPPIAERSPLRDIELPPAPAFPQHDDDVDMEPRRRLPTTSSLNNAPESSRGQNANQIRPIAALPTRVSKKDESEPRRKTPAAERATLTGFGNPKTTSPYFNNSVDINENVENLDFNFVPTHHQLVRTIPSPSDSQTMSPYNKGKQRALKSKRADDSSSDEFIMDDVFADPTFLESVERLEKEALENKNRTSQLPLSDGSSVLGGSSSSRDSSKPKDTQPSTQFREVIEIEDSDDEMLEPDNKENEPVPTRHVRQRTMEEGTTSGAKSRPIMSQPLSQKTGLPIIRAKNEDDIIEID